MPLCPGKEEALHNCMMKSNEDQGLQTFYDKIQDNFPNFEGYSDIFPANPDGYFNWWTYCARN
ncbi:MAG: hypothetical protein AAF673_04705 [Pseudomonadota bacterium]